MSHCCHGSPGCEGRGEKHACNCSYRTPATPDPEEKEALFTVIIRDNSHLTYRNVKQADVSQCGALKLLAKNDVVIAYFAPGEWKVAGNPAFEPTRHKP